jgi:hypothetical protein
LIRFRRPIEVGSFSVTPILADHYGGGDSDDGNSLTGSVIYMVKVLGGKIIIRWDFLSLSSMSKRLGE